MIKFKNLTKKFGDNVVLNGLNLEFKDGETTVILGSSGSGKSTLLRCINLLEIPDGGELELGGDKINFTVKFRKKICCRFASTRGWSFRALIYFRT